MNFLILAAGTRNKVVQYFKKTFDGVGTVVATDASNLGPAIYDADKYYIVPSITAPGYIDIILDICKNEKIDGILCRSKGKIHVGVGDLLVKRFHACFDLGDQFAVLLVKLLHALFTEKLCTFFYGHDKNSFRVVVLLFGYDSAV